LADHVCAGFGATANVNCNYGYPPLVNHAESVQRFEQTASNLFGRDQVLTADPVMAAEDFAYYLQKVPGCFMFVGAGDGADYRYAHHHPMFDLDERAIIHAAALYVEMALSHSR